MKRIFFLSIVLALLSLSMPGCGAGRTQVSGKVTFEDGSPLTKGTVRARADGDGIEVKGSVKEDGTFTLYEVKPGDGVPAGKQYKVWLANTVEIIPSTQKVMDENIGKMVPAAPTERELVHKDFTNVNTTTIVSLDVKNTKPMVFDITVKKP